MKRHNIIVLGSILVFIPAAYHGIILLSGLAGAVFFYELGKISATIDRWSRLKGSADVVDKVDPPVDWDVEKQARTSPLRQLPLVHLEEKSKKEKPREEIQPGLSER